MQKQFPLDRKIHTFDILDSKYFVLYYGDNNIEVWEIEMKIYLIYKMKLPLYVYSDYKFSPDPGRHWRTFYRGFFGIIMSDTNKSELIIYSLESNQHNSFIMSRDVTNFFN